ncbi:hypothetical protein L6R49_13955 [Myxococcota bacterium]|nr:hypothetical protein [Myxococcota bacterium]
MLLLLLTSLLSAASADTLTCDAASGPKLRFVEWSKSGGAAPGPETPMSSASWTLGETTLYEVTRLYGGGEEARGDLDWQWDLSSRVTLSRPKNEGYAPVTVTRYTADVTVWTRSGAALPGLTGPKHTVKMRCELVEEHGVP